MFYYTILQAFIWAFLHAFFLFWGVYFPFSYRKLQMSGQLRYAHLASVLLALVVPLLPALLPLKDGFLNTRNPTLVCLGRNSAYTYFLFVLPLSIMCCSIACFMILTFWKIFNVRIMIVRRHEKMDKLLCVNLMCFSISYTYPLHPLDRQGSIFFISIKPSNNYRFLFPCLFTIISHCIDLP